MRAFAGPSKRVFWPNLFCCVRTEMSGIGDALTVGILLTLIFGAVCFYLYSRLSQNEKRTGLLENLFLQLKLNTEASLSGPEPVESSSAGPLRADDVGGIEEVEYSELLKEIPGLAAPAQVPAPAPAPAVAAEAPEDAEEAALEVLQSLGGESPKPAPTTTRPAVEANYESMTLRELQTLARQKGITGVAQRKKDIIDALKKQGIPPPVAHLPLTQQDGDLEGHSAEPKEGFQISLDA